jgi:hypothetical protein
MLLALGIKYRSIPAIGRRTAAVVNLAVRIGVLDLVLRGKQPGEFDLEVSGPGTAPKSF